MIAYSDGPVAMDWLADAFGLQERARWLDDDGVLVHGEMMAGGGLIMLATPTRTRGLAAIPETSPALADQVSDSLGSSGLCWAAATRHASSTRADAEHEAPIDRPASRCAQPPESPPVARLVGPRLAVPVVPRARFVRLWTPAGDRGSPSGPPPRPCGRQGRRVLRRRTRSARPL